MLHYEHGKMQKTDKEGCITMNSHCAPTINLIPTHYVEVCLLSDNVTARIDLKIQNLTIYRIPQE